MDSEDLNINTKCPIFEQVHPGEKDCRCTIPEKFKLHLAARDGDDQELLDLLKAGYPINGLCNSGKAPLHYAAQYGHRETIMTLLKHGADINVKTTTGSTPLHYSVYFRQDEATKTLLNMEANVNEKDNYKILPIQYALYPLNLKVFEWLEKTGTVLEGLKIPWINDDVTTEMEVE